MGLQIKYNKLISTTNFRQKNKRAVQIFQQIRNTFHFAGGEYLEKYVRIVLYLSLY